MRAAALLFVLSTVSSIGAEGVEQTVALTGNEILEIVREAIPRSGYRVVGSIRDPERGSNIPLEITALPDRTSWRLGDSKLDILADESVTPTAVHVWQGGTLTALPLEQRGESALSKNITYADLAMDFLDWPDVTFLREERPQSVAGNWVIRLVAPDDLETYGTVDLWVSKTTGIVTQAEFWSPLGKLAKRVDVRSVQTARWGHFPKYFSVDTFDTTSEAIVGRIYVTLSEPEVLPGVIIPAANRTGLMPSRVPLASSERTSDVIKGDAAKVQTPNETPAPAMMAAVEASSPSQEQGTSRNSSTPPVELTESYTTNLPSNPSLWSKLVEAIERQNALLTLILGTFTLLLVCAAYLVGWKRGHSA